MGRPGKLIMTTVSVSDGQWTRLHYFAFPDTLPSLTFLGRRMQKMWGSVLLAHPER